MNNWQRGYVHHAILECGSCKGEGVIRGNPCVVCDGAGRREVGCGGEAERDLNYRTLANCIAEDRMVSPDEVTAA